MRAVVILIAASWMIAVAASSNDVAHQESLLPSHGDEWRMHVQSAAIIAANRHVDSDLASYCAPTNVSTAQDCAPCLDYCLLAVSNSNATDRSTSCACAYALGRCLAASQTPNAQRTCEAWLQRYAELFNLEEYLPSRMCLSQCANGIASRHLDNSSGKLEPVLIWVVIISSCLIGCALIVVILTFYQYRCNDWCWGSPTYPVSERTISEFRSAQQRQDQQQQMQQQQLPRPSTPRPRFRREKSSEDRPASVASVLEAFV